MNKRNLSETDICDRFITPALRGAGWLPERILREYSFTDGRIIVRGRLVSRGRRKRADYLLVHEGVPLAVIEAKDNSQALGAGMQQALGYSDALGVPHLPFVFSSNGDGFLFHDRTGQADSLESVLALEAFPSPEELWRRGAAALLRGRHEERAPLLPGECDPGHGGGDRQGAAAHPAGDGHRHGQNSHRLPDHLAVVEGGPQEAHSVSGRSQRAGEPDDGE
jgi:type I site-specific restriction endonuclease